MDYSQMRENYHTDSLSRNQLDPNPFHEFHKWFVLAKDAQGFDANAMVLGTASKKGRPSTRTVLLKKCDENGFVFFTNYESKKARELEENPYASLTFYWREIGRQITIQGHVKKLSREDSENYFSTRPRKSQIASWASMQDTPLSSRSELEEQFVNMQNRFLNQEVPCPDYWGGYIVKPFLFDFWAGKEHRLHDRFEYHIENGQWIIVRLSP